MRGILAGALILLSSAAAAGSGGHVRSDQEVIRDWLTDGYKRSATFRALVDEIDGLPGIVYIDAMAGGARGLDGALLHTVAGSRELPLLRVVMRLGLSRTIGIATLGHELQHVAEVLRASRDDATSSILRLLAADDDTHQTGSSHFETREAQLVFVRVRDELGLGAKR